ncbi:MAG: RNase adapter RapZ, partial [Xanthomonadales bacterium]|nr:RNase adapter RapZ [Xanthomonadales bacterium]
MSEQASQSLGMQPLLVVSGLSGSGKTVALRSLEDLGYFCIDNLPAALLTDFVQQTLGPDSGYGKVAVGVDARSPLKELDALPKRLAELADRGFPGAMLYLEASDEVLVKRFSETRRRHPLSCSGISLQEAIARERQVLKPLRQIADLTIDTSSLNVHELRRQVALTVGVVPGKLLLLLESFAFKHGVPSDADFVFDARFLPNPHWEPRLRPLSGRDTAVRQYFSEHGMVLDFLAD